MYTFEGGADAARLVLNQYDPAVDSFRGKKAGPFWDAVHLAHKMGRFGKGRRIAVIDTGFDISIPYLSSQSLAWPTPANARTAHGSAVALLIHEVAPMAHLDLYPVFDDNGFNTELALKAVSDAIEAGADVVNMSFGEEVPFDDVYNKGLPLSSEQDPVVAMTEDRLAYPDWRMRLRTRTLNPLEAATAMAVKNGCSVIASAGNRSEGIFSPALLPGVVAVGFIKVLDAFSEGEELKSAGFADFYQQNQFMDLALLQPPGTIGSSFANPLVSGFVATMPEPALMRSYITAASLAGTADVIMSGVAHPWSQQVTDATDRLYRAAVDAIPHKHWSEPLEQLAPCPECTFLAQSSYVNGGLFLMNSGQLDAADWLLRAAAVFAPSSPDAAANLAMLIALRADIARRSGNLETVREYLPASLELMTHALELRPDQPFYSLRAEEFRKAIEHPEQWELAR
jgi:hypothetical protein